MKEPELPNRLTLYGRIDEIVAKEMIEAIRNMKLRGVKSAVLEINSIGGSLVSALHIYQNLFASGIEWTGLVVGECLSSAVIVLQACEIRIAYSEAVFQVHESRRKFVVDDMVASKPLEYYQGLVADAYHNCEALEKRGDKALRRRLNAGPSLFNRHFENNLHFSATEALDMGIIDNIVH